MVLKNLQRSAEAANRREWRRVIGTVKAGTRL
jgi:hypothetical protein